MVASRLVNFPEEIVDEAVVDLPHMMFAEGEEPVGVRVLTYQSSRSINTILNALNEDEIQFLRDSSFGKLVEIAEKPAFSGRFARYLLSRQLKVEKKHEAWFRFAGKPIRFSLREFAIVTGLPCGELPNKKKSKKKNDINEKPYWPELFGSMEEMRVSRAVKMLRKKTVIDPDIRMKLALLAIVSSVLLSTNLNMKMLKEDEVSLSQNTIALQGFALALQLVLVEAAKKKTLNPAHARELDRKAEVVVQSIIPEDPQRPLRDSVFVWTDEVFDIKVDNLVKLICEEFVFTKDMFKGGATKGYVEELREAKKVVGKRNQTRQKEIQSVEADEDKIASVVLSLVRPELKRIDGNLAAAVASMKEFASSSLQYKDDVLATVSGMIEQMKSEIIGSLGALNPDVGSHGHHNSLSSGNVSKQVPSKQPTVHVEAGIGLVGSEDHCINPAPCNVSIPGSSKQLTGVIEYTNHKIIENVLENLSHYSTPPGSPNEVPETYAVTHHQISTLPQASPLPRVNNQVTSGSRHSGPFDLPSFSLGLTQDKNARPPCEDDQMGENGNVIGLETHNDTLLARKSKRMRTVPAYLLTGYHCGGGILNRAREGQLCGTSYYEMSVIREKYVRLSTILKKPWFYIPFCIGKKHWIGLCLDFTAAKLYVLDCNAGLNTESVLRKYLLPISEMLPLILKQCGVSVAGADTPLLVERIQGVPQNHNAGDAAITTSLLIQTHALFGTDHCLGISPSVIADEAQRAAVMIYEFHVKL
ncbi:hypothetical protein Bca52824_084474 [Brassica carinata]|uniref:Ubiquitin-like protease family profile domain-containing protein n=1 Tax=Brassica carinata TaxID=52824 RepID=A0A8X7PNS5_BRACI|nr:hypothetical protein Bca52824_084474 [Brassica carinata]